MYSTVFVKRGKGMDEYKEEENTIGLEMETLHARNSLSLSSSVIDLPSSLSAFID